MKSRLGNENEPICADEQFWESITAQLIDSYPGLFGISFLLLNIIYLRHRYWSGWLGSNQTTLEENECLRLRYYKEEKYEK